jgi:hypothetical protein
LKTWQIVKLKPGKIYQTDPMHRERYNNGGNVYFLDTRATVAGSFAENRHDEDYSEIEGSTEGQKRQLFPAQPGNQTLSPSTSSPSVKTATHLQQAHKENLPVLVRNRWATHMARISCLKRDQFRWRGKDDARETGPGQPNGEVLKVQAKSTMGENEMPPRILIKILDSKRTSN